MKRLPVGRRGGGHQALLLAAHQPRILAHTGHGLVSVSVSHLVAIAVTPNKYLNIDFCLLNSRKKTFT